MYLWSRCENSSLNEELLRNQRFRFWGSLDYLEAFTIFYIKLLQNIGNMEFNCSGSDPQYLTNFLVRETLHQAGYDLLFSPCEFG